MLDTRELTCASAALHMEGSPLTTLSSIQGFRKPLYRVLKRNKCSSRAHSHPPDDFLAAKSLRQDSGIRRGSHEISRPNGGLHSLRTCTSELPCVQHEL